MMELRGALLQTSRGFTLLEAMVVVVLVGILSALAVPNIQATISHYKATTNSREALVAINAARGLSQRNNAPVELSLGVETVNLAEAVVRGSPAEVRKVVERFVVKRTITMPGDLQFLRIDTLAADGRTVASSQAAPGASLRFCSSSDNYFREDTVAAAPICGVGNLASRTAKIVFTTGGEVWHVRVNAPLGNVDLKAGP